MGRSKPKRFGGHVAVDGERGSGEGRGTEGAFVHPLAGVFKAGFVAGQHLDIGQHVMAPGDGLRGLQMGEAGHHPIGTRLGLGEEGAHQGGEALDRGVALVAHPEAEIDGHLIVARARGVQAACGGADQVFQAGFDVHVDVFERGREGEIPGLNL